jgi:sRNA-binding carbon storage regulator CsrA
MYKRFMLLLAAFVLSAGLSHAHGTADHLTGTITRIDGDHIQIKDQAGKTVTVMLGKTTKYLKSEKPSTKAELKVGTRVVIDAKMDTKMKMYAAEEVRIGVVAPAKPAATTKAK